MKELVLDGNNFTNIEGFYREIDKVLTKDIDWKTGHNLDAYNDLLRGGFGVHEYGEPIIIKWLHFNKCKKELGIDFVLNILEVTLAADNSVHDCKLELY